MCISQNLLEAKAEQVVKTTEKAKKNVTLLRLKMDKIAKGTTVLNEKVQLAEAYAKQI